LLGLWNAHGSRKPFEPDPAKINIFIWGNLKGDLSMKQIKRIMAFALAMVLTLAMSITVFATDGTTIAKDETTDASITISNLSTREPAQIKLYKAISISEDHNSWIVEDWATNYFDENGQLRTQTVTDESGDESTVAYTYDEIANAVGTAADATASNVKTVDGTETYLSDVTISNLEIGAYLVVVAGEDVNYSKMFVHTYDDNYDSDSTNGNLLVAIDAKAVAKSSNGSITKVSNGSADGKDGIVYKGEELSFTITATIPYKEGTLSSFQVVDKPTGLEELAITSAKLGNIELSDPAFTPGTDDEGAAIYTFNLDSYITTLGSNYPDLAGTTLTIEYTAKVSGTSDYSNTAWTVENTDKGDTTDGEDVTGKTGSASLIKYGDTNKTIKLSGAKYIVSSDSEKHDQYVVAEMDAATGAYVLTEWTNDINRATRVETDGNGAVKITGVDEGTYTFTEETAPSGYSVNTTPNTTQELTSTNPEVDTFQIDTKLSSLPETGGIGTTIFTIAGCLIMIAAAGMYFASRRKSAK
jgi:fimbrial isopeptide formation D2 family protein/LPXTG-motif cell wall-anchored protein